MKPEINYYNDYHFTRIGIFIIILHLVTAVSIFYYLSIRIPSVELLVITGVLSYLTLIGISAGYHRLYAHPSYKIRIWPVEFLLLALGTMTLQSSVKKWASDHRRHHKYTDTEQDPYNANKGFWHAHVLWLFTTHRPIDDQIIHDLNKNKLVVWQHKNYYWFALLLNVIVSAAIGFITGDMLGAFVFSGLLRIILTYHQTWSINSIAHFWGKKTYSKDATARDSLLLMLIIPSEGNHNLHHTLQADYRNSLKWYGIDPTKWIVKTFNSLGWTSNLIEYDKKTILKTMLKCDRDSAFNNLSKLSTLPDELKKVISVNREVLKKDIEESINKLYSSITSSYEKMTIYKDKLRQLKKDSALKKNKKLLRLQKTGAKNNYREDLKKWYQIIDVLLDPKLV